MIGTYQSLLSNIEFMILTSSKGETDVMFGIFFLVNCFYLMPARAFMIVSVDQCVDQLQHTGSPFQFSVILHQESIGCRDDSR